MSSRSPEWTWSGSKCVLDVFNCLQMCISLANIRHTLLLIKCSVSICVSDTLILSSYVWEKTKNVVLSMWHCINIKVIMNSSYLWNIERDVFKNIFATHYDNVPVLMYHKRSWYDTTDCNSLRFPDISTLEVVKRAFPFQTNYDYSGSLFCYNLKWQGCFRK